MSPLPIDFLAGIVNFSRTNWAFTIPAYAAVAISCILLYRLFLHPLAGFPGPLEASLSGTWRDRRYFRGSWHEDILQAHEKYGPIVRIGPNELSVVDEQAIKQLYAHGSKSVKAKWYATWDFNASQNVFATRSKEEHSFMRKRISPAYSMSAMLRYEQYIQPCLDLMMQRLKAHADQDHTVVMSDWVSWLTFDVVGTLAYGNSFGQIENESDTMDLAKTIHQGFYISANIGHWIGQSTLLHSPTFNKIMSAIGIPSPFATFNNWTMKKIQERRLNRGKNERADMLRHFLEMRSRTNGPVTDQEVLNEAGSIIGAGADTTSVAMGTCIYYICRHQDVYQQVQKEIDGYYEAHNLQDPITYKQTQDLPLLNAAIREAMRLLPSITYQLPRIMPEDMIIADRKVAAGTSIGMSPLAANRNQAVWGTDANEFKPSRWLESEEKSRYLNANDMTFGGNGARMCIGRNLALVEVHKFMAQLLRNFDVAFEDPEKPWKVSSQWFALQSDMRMTIKSRGKTEQ